MPPAASLLAAASVQATTWGTSGSETTLVLYDTGGAYGYLGELYAMSAGNLATHFGKVTAEPVSSYVAGQVNKYTVTVYLGSTYNEPLPTAFLNDVLSTSHPVLWSGENVWQLSGTGAADTAFQAAYGWDPSTSYFDATDTVATVAYNGQTLTRDPAGGPLLAPHIVAGAPVAPVVLGAAACTDTSGAATACDPLAQSTGTSFPWAIRSGNLTYVGEIPFSYATEADRYLAFADLLYAALAPGAPTTRQALVRLEDVSPGLDTPAELKAIADYLYSVHVPFSVGVIPAYLDPNGAGGTGPINENISQTKNATIKAFNAALSYMVARGGTIVEHGFTHQYSNVANPYDAVSGNDFEFYRARCTPTGAAPYAVFDVPCPTTDWVVGTGPLPGDSAAWAQGRASSGRALFAKAGLPTPTIWETPHYAASAADYRGIGQVFPVRYERELLFGGLITPGAPVDNTHVFGQFFPYTVQDVYGSLVIPEDLGNYEPTAANHNPPRPPSTIVANARAELAVRQGVASFFFHPYYGLSYLKQIVSGIQGLGYSFVSAPSTEAPTVTTTSLPPGNVGSPYAQRLGATAGLGALSWSVSAGSLPAGLTLNATTGLVSGTPTTTGTRTVTLKVTDHATPTPAWATRTLTLAVNPPLPPPLVVTTATLPAATVGVSYQATVQATGGKAPLSWSVSRGWLPPGLSLDPATGTVSGTPTAMFDGTVTFTVTDSQAPAPQAASAPLAMTVAAATPSTVPTLGVYPDASGYRGPGEAVFGVTLACSAAVSGNLAVSFSLGGVAAATTQRADCPAGGLAYVPVQVPGAWSAGTASVTVTYRAAGQQSAASGTVAIS